MYDRWLADAKPALNFHSENTGQILDRRGQGSYFVATLSGFVEHSLSVPAQTLPHPEKPSRGGASINLEGAGCSFQEVPIELY